MGRKKKENIVDEEPKKVQEEKPKKTAKTKKTNADAKPKKTKKTNEVIAEEQPKEVVNVPFVQEATAVEKSIKELEEVVLTTSETKEEPKENKPKKSIRRKSFLESFKGWNFYNTWNGQITDY